MNFSTPWKYVYFVGIGGIGMSALARWFHVNGFLVAGYDRTPTPLTDTLQAEGIQVCFDDNLNSIPTDFLKDSLLTLVVYTPAIPADHRQLVYFRETKFEIQKRSQVLGWLTNTLKTVAVAGTHGKTTTSSMVAHLFRAAGQNCTAFLGGITQNYGTNFLLNDPTENVEEILCVVEADEFDRSFLTLFPSVAIVTSTDADHLDIYGEHESLMESFRSFVSQIRSDGMLFMRKGLELKDSTSANVVEYSLHEGDVHCTNLQIKDARFMFDVVHPEGEISGFSLSVPGFHNVENALAAIAVALYVGLSPEQIRAGINTYKGVQRRFEYIIESETAVFIDDYAHHPTEIEAFLSSVRALYPTRHITAVFQPHLFSRTRDFAEGFANSLSLADRLLLLDIYPARELPIPGVTSRIIFDKVKLEDKTQISADQLISVLKMKEIDVLVTIGAGDISKYVGYIKEMLQVPFAN
ncbi:UDP-N-acetylmuramate--L-alanine ligase [Arundinibacter roseus]|uniref:UDP-N-acetylmuramate--L-alanine ligase n=1 Tax=Arundinibacter roseus TaxID=2070510 RepID=A0A4R4KAQ0_9BACT|nr:UDP-N-acetylmuramate--L-alanine ligase [Arundinibacter roseus]TDB63686.1 UDP-N-acetylmuramate--L-alanine ligase [Arundinibacter roseus]